ncbi:methyltransferase domain-containing protein [Mangrovimicrobium sediminis]|uniref:Methyltransferase domain-containing protein n=1 Tax=Mangrovimicrobium sediminis TaxID=2562682 RepID=A0A4Z0LXI8_9GAMM|nr:class I SAM-dependent methyltransferase [Haliea sp. SAOS-164]TGD71868.1 methyltransferase domain-containing protein [Haliea sp. SAOS-164]
MNSADTRPAEGPAQGRLQPAEWAHFWRQSPVTSMLDAFEASYDLEIRAFWEQHMLPAPEQLVDLATGNGALVWIADEILNRGEPRTRITGVDFASTDPFKTLGRKRRDYPMVEFIGNTNIEALPMADASVDMAVSQWGFEYAQPERAVLELLRVLKPASRVALICHYEDSDIVRHSRGAYGVYDHFLNQAALFDRYLALADATPKRAGAQQLRTVPAYQQALGQLNQSIHALGQFLGSTPGLNPARAKHYLDCLQSVFTSNRLATRAARREAIIGYREQMLSAMRRAEDLYSSVLTREECAQLVGMFEAAGFTVRHNAPVRHARLGDVGMGIAVYRQ